MSNSLDPDQDRTVYKGLQQTTKVTTNKDICKSDIISFFEERIPLGQDYALLHNIERIISL